MIEFRCPGCNKLLRTSESKAGRTADCPNCGSPVTVPEPGPPTAPIRVSVPSGGAGGAEFRAGPATGRAEPRRAGTKNCPMCGAEVPAEARKCEFCGETLAAPAAPRAAPARIDAGDVLSTSWEIYKSQLGILIAVSLLAVFISLIPALPSIVVSLQLQSAAPADRMPLFLLLLAFQIPPLIVQAFVSSGQSIVLLKVARGQDASVGDLFAGGPYFLGMLGNSLVFWLVSQSGFMLANVIQFMGRPDLAVLINLVNLVPAVIALVVWWPYWYVVVDENPGGLRPLKRAAELTRGNRGHSILLWLVSIALAIGGMILCCVGLIFTVPLGQLLFAVAYCRMVGHRTARV